jgi:hypothetical protein
MEVKLVGALDCKPSPCHSCSLTDFNSIVLAFTARGFIETRKSDDGAVAITDLKKKV